MNRKTLLLSFGLASCTLLFQLRGIVAQNASVASASTPPTIVSVTPSPAHDAFRPRTAKRPTRRVLPRVTIPRLTRPTVATTSTTALDQPGIDDAHRQLTLQILKLLPTECQAKLEHFYLLRNKPENRGLAGYGIVMVSAEVSDEEFVALLTHEMAGHFWDITCLMGTPDAGETSFRDGDTPIYANDPSASFYAISWTDTTTKRRTSSPEHFVTGYASAKDCFEDLAESVSYYLLQPDAFAKRAKTNPVLAQKLAWLQAHFPVQERVATGTDTGNPIAWDSTKLAYTWLKVN